MKKILLSTALILTGCAGSFINPAPMPQSVLDAYQIDNASDCATTQTVQYGSDIFYTISPEACKWRYNQLQQGIKKQEAEDAIAKKKADEEKAAQLKKSQQEEIAREHSPKVLAAKRLCNASMNGIGNRYDLGRGELIQANPTGTQAVMCVIHYHVANVYGSSVMHQVVYYINPNNGQYEIVSAV